MNKKYTWVFVLGAMLAARLSPAQDVDYGHVSLVSLLANPKEYVGKKVSVVGYLSVDPEDELLYLHREDYEQGLLDNGIRLVIVEPLRSQLKSGQYVEVHGLFAMYSTKSSLGGSSGRIVEIIQITPWPFAQKQPQARGCFSWN